TEKLKFGSSYFVRDDYIAKEPETIAKVLRCVAQGTAITLANPEGVVKTHWEVFPEAKPSGNAYDEAFRLGLHILAVRAECLATGEVTPVPGCHDALGALLIEQAGYPAVYMSGFSVSASFGKPDVGILTMTEMVERAGLIASATSLPVIADADTGHGGIANVAE